MSIREHGGAVRYWRHKTNGSRAVLCADGKVLMLRGTRWREPLTVQLIAAATAQQGDYVALNMIERNTEWQEDTRSAMSAAITRTGREARRRDV